MRVSGVNSGPGALCGARFAALFAATLVVGVALAGCAGTIEGHAVAAPPGSAVTLQSPDRAVPPQAQRSPAGVGQPAGDLSELLPAPADFPPGYGAQPLPHREAMEAAADLTGIHAGAEVTPLRCTPARLPADPANMAMITGAGNQGNSTLSVLLTRPGTDLSGFRAQLRSCLKAEASQFGAHSDITRTMRGDPKVPADAALAYTQNVTSGSGHVRLTQSSLTQVAQVGGVRVTVTSMSLGPAGRQAASPDEAAVSGLLQRAVAKLRGH